MDHMLYKSLLHRVTTEHVRNLNVCVCMGQSFSFASAAVVCRMLMCRPLQPQAMQNGTLLLESGMCYEMVIAFCVRIYIPAADAGAWTLQCCTGGPGMA